MIIAFSPSPSPTVSCLPRTRAAAPPLRLPGAPERLPVELRGREGAARAQPQVGALPQDPGGGVPGKEGENRQRKRATVLTSFISLLHKISLYK